MEINRKILLQQFLPLSEAEIQVSFIQVKPVLGVFLLGLSLSSCPQHSLKALFFLNPLFLLKYFINCEQNFSYLDLDYPTFGLTVTGLARVYCAL
jgi:hypothetical protein